MDSKRDHRGGHRNIYDQIDLEIINSKGPGPEKSLNPKYNGFLKFLFSDVILNMFSQMIFGIFYSSSLESKIRANAMF